MVKVGRNKYSGYSRSLLVSLKRQEDLEGEEGLKEFGGEKSPDRFQAPLGMPRKKMRCDSGQRLII